MAKNEAKIKFTAETGGFNESIKKANSEMSELRAELKLNEAQMKTTGTTVEGLEQKHKILSNQLKASQDKTEALNQKVNKAVEIYGENSDEVSKLRTQLLNAQTAEEKITQAINACNAEIEQQKNASNQASNEAEELGESLGDASEGADEATESFTVLKGAMANLVADGIQKVADGLVNIGTSAFETANDIDKATNTFITKTGESADAGEEFESIMLDIYNGNYGESFEDIADSMATVKTSLGNLSNSELQKITTDAIVLRDTFDMDVNESVRAVNSLMDQFGISADDAFNLMAQGAQKGLNQNGDLLDVINEYSVQFKGAGYSAEDMFNMLANGVEAGTWSVDKLGDAVKEFNIRMSDGSAKEAVEALGFSWEVVSESWSEGGDSAKEVFNMLFNELDGLENTTEGYGIGVGLLGTMYEDLGQDAVLALSKTQGEISKSKDALEEIDSIKYDDLGSAFEGIKRNLQTSVSEPMKNEVMPAVNEFIENVDWQGVGNVIGGAFGTITEGAVALASGIQEAVQWMSEHKGITIALAGVIGILAGAITAYNVVQGIKSAMDAAEVTTVWALVAAHWAQATAAMAAIAPYVLVVAAIAAVIAIIVLCITYWDEIVVAVQNAWTSIMTALQTAWDWMTTLFGTLGTWVDVNVIQPVVAFFVGLWTKLQEIWNTIVSVVQVAFMLIGSVITGAIQIITLPFMFIWENCKTYVFEAWNWIKEKVSTGITAVKNVISTVMTAIKTVFATIWNAIKTTISSVWNGIKTTVSTVVNSIKTTISNVWNGIKSTTSSVFNAVKNVISSVWNSIQNNILNPVLNAIQTTVSSVWNGINSITSSVFNSVKSTASSVWNGIKSAIITPIEEAKNKVKGIVDAIKGFFSGMKISLPNIKLPHFSISGSFSLNPPSVPHFGISWHKDGGIFTKPTIFNTPYGLHGVGEAGAEAILPIDRIEGYIAGAIEKTMKIADTQALSEAIADLANRPIVMNVNGKNFATATASDTDSVNGLRTILKNRGVVL